MSGTQTIDALIRLRAAQDPARPMVVDAHTHLRYGDLDTGTREVAAGLIQAGVGKGSRVGLVMPNSCDWVRIALALNRIGAVLVPLSTLLTGRELAAQLRTAAVSHLIAVDEFRGHRYEAELPREGLSALRATRTPERAVRLPRDRVGDDLVDAMAATVHWSPHLTRSPGVLRERSTWPGYARCSLVVGHPRVCSDETAIMAVDSAALVDFHSHGGGFRCCSQIG